MAEGTTMEQTLLFEFRPTRDAGEALRDEGTDRVLENEPEGWHRTALEAISDLAKNGKKFTVDDVMARIERPEHHNSIGAVMLKAHRSGLIHKVGDTKSRRPEARARVIPVYTGGAR